MSVDIVVQHPLRLLRVGIAESLATNPRFNVLGAVVSPDDLVEFCLVARPALAVIAITDNVWELRRLTFRLRKRQPTLRFVGVHRGGSFSPDRLDQTGIRHTVTVDDGEGAMHAAVLAASRSPITAVHPPAPHRSVRLELTARELDVLQLIGAGCTSRDISDRLKISYKTVDNHKQRIFSKLGAQNQAQAVSIALRRGYIAGDVVLKLAQQVS